MYNSLAAELMSIRMELLHIPESKRLFQMEKGELYIMYWLQHEGGVSHPKRISAETGVSSARVAAVLNSLEVKKYIIRSVDPADNRRVLVRLTDKGVAYIQEKYNEALSYTAEMLSAIGEEDAKNFVRIQKLIIGQFTKHRRLGGE